MKSHGHQHEFSGHHRPWTTSIWPQVSHVDVSGLCCLPPQAMLRSMVYTVPEDHRWVQGLTAARAHIDVHAQCYHWRPCWCPGSILPYESLLVAMGRAAAWDYRMAMAPCCLRGQVWCPWKVLQQKTVNIHCMNHHLKPDWSSCQVLSSGALWNTMVHAPPDCKRQGSYFCSGLNDCTLAVEKDGQRRLLWQPLHHYLYKSNSLDRKTW